MYWYLEKKTRFSRVINVTHLLFERNIETDFYDNENGYKLTTAVIETLKISEIYLS